MTENWMNWNNESVIKTLEDDWTSHMEQRRTLHEVLASLPDSLFTLLDAGCGTAITYEHFEGRFNYRGIDITPLMIEKAKEKFPEINVEVKDILDLTEEDKADVTMSSDVIIHTPTWIPYLDALWRVTGKVMVLRLSYIWNKPTVDHFDGKFFNRKLNLMDLIHTLLGLNPYKLEIIRVEHDEKAMPDGDDRQIFVLWKGAP